MGVPFKLYTDNKAVSYLRNQKAVQPKFGRWFQFLQGFDFTVEHVSGRSNVIADCLSRKPQVLASMSQVDVHLKDVDFGTAYNQDSYFQEIYSKMGTPAVDSLEPRLKTRASYFVKIDDRLYLSDGTEFRLAIPSGDIRRKLLSEVHDTVTGGHLGVEKIYELLSRLYFWPRMYKDTRHFVLSCETCLKVKTSTALTPGLLQQYPVPTKNWEWVSLDLVSGLPKSKAGNDAVIVFVDKLSKMAHFVACKTTVTAVQLADIFFHTVFRIHGLPKVLISDRDPRFNSAFWRALFRKLQTRLNMSSPLRPQTDGQTERVNKVLGDMVRCFSMGLRNEWESSLIGLEFAYNNSQQSSTECSPFFCNYGQHPVTAGVLFQKRPVKDAVEPTAVFVERMRTVLTRAKDSIRHAQEVQAHSYGKKHRHDSFAVGDLVLINAKLVRQNEPQMKAKLKPRFLGPFTVTQVLSDVSYRLDIPKTLRIHSVIHIAHLKRYVTRVTKFQQTVTRPPPLHTDKRGSVYIVERIKATKYVRGKQFFLVKWKGFADTDSTWEPYANVKHVPNLLKKFTSSYGKHRFRPGRV